MLPAHLALEADRPHRRDELAEMFWPDRPQGVARTSLRQALANLRKAIGDQEAAHTEGGAPPFLLVSRAELQFNPDSAHWVDVGHFRRRLAACEMHGHPPSQVCPDCLPSLTEAVALYRDDFMAGFTLPDSLGFDEWQFFHAEVLRDELAGALERLVRWYSSRGEYEPAIAHARRWLELDPLQESAHRHLMGLYAQANYRTAALRQYRVCMRVLEEELSVGPSDETAALAGEGQVVFVTGGAGRGKTALMEEFARRAQSAYPDLLAAIGNCSAYGGVGDPYLPFRELLGMLTGDVEARWAAGAITREMACRLWALLPITVQALLDHGSFLIGIFLSGVALLSRAAAVAPDGAGWLAQLKELSEREKAKPGDGSTEALTVSPSTALRTGSAEPLQVLAQSQLFEQYTDVLHALAAQRPLLLVLDNMQWADAASISLFFHLGLYMTPLKKL